jgi:hypothetical protein
VNTFKYIYFPQKPNMSKQLKRFWFIAWLPLAVYLNSCGGNNTTAPQAPLTVQYEKGSYGFDHSFLKQQLPGLLELKYDSGGAAILVSPNFQGRVMTSTANADSGTSFGWINYDLIASHQIKSQFNPVGGEERFWLGPEGGQFALFFKKGDSFNIRHWQVPAVVDTVPYRLVSSSQSSAVFSQSANLSNYSGTDFQIQITRTIQVIDKSLLQQQLHVEIPKDLKSVAYQSTNQVKNTGLSQWKKEKGLISVWLLGQMRPSDKTVVVIPFQSGKNNSFFITDNYFGKIPKDRLLVKDSVLFFKCDGKQRGKIGIAPQISGHLAASYDFERNILTVISFAVDRDGLYVNSKWEMQKQPYKGDVVNSYNDGPLADGSQLGPFYEIESSSDARELKPGQSQTYTQLTSHFQGDYTVLKELAMRLLGVDLEDVKKIL